MISGQDVSRSTTRKRWKKQRAFRIEPGQVTALWKLVSDNNADARLKVQCSDDSEITTRQPLTLLEFPNARRRSILGIVFDSGYGDGPSLRGCTGIDVQRVAGWVEWSGEA